MRQAVLALVLFSALVSLGWTRRTCYNADGTDRNANLPFTVYKPCSNDPVSMCCAIANGGNDICDPLGASGLCYNPVGNKYWRRSCTDRSWKSSSCLKLFVNGTGFDGTVTQKDQHGNNITDVALTRCDDGSWCYSTNNIFCCTQQQGYFVNYDTGEEQQQNPTVAVTTSTITASSAPVAASDTTPPTSGLSHTGSTSLSGGAIAGIVVGAIVGFIFVFLLGCFLGDKSRRSANLPPQEVRADSARLGRSTGMLSRSERGATSSRSRYELPAGNESRTTHSQTGNEFGSPTV